MNFNFLSWMKRNDGEIKPPMERKKFDIASRKTILIGVGITGILMMLLALSVASAMSPSEVLVNDSSQVMTSPTPQIVIQLSTPTPVIATPIVVLTPFPTPIKTPMPIRTPTQRWCNSSGCFDGVPPTPIPTPIKTPTPKPTVSPIPSALWAQMGFKCKVPDRLVNERWVAAYRYNCTCRIREKYGLGEDFSPFEGCQSQGAWRDESCQCLNVVCASSGGLC